MIKEVGDNVILSESQEDLENEIANMDLLLEHLLKLNPKMPEQDKKELRHTFEVATTAMKMIWMNFENENIEVHTS